MSVLMSHALTHGLSPRVVPTAPIIALSSVKSRILSGASGEMTPVVLTVPKGLSSLFLNFTFSVT